MRVFLGGGGGGHFVKKRQTPALVRIGSVDVRIGEGQDDNLMDYSLSKSAPTMDTVEEVMQLFESGGKVRLCF